MADKPIVYNIMGVSGAGKDTVGRIIQRLVPKTVKVKWVQPTKDAIEAAYNLPTGMMEDREARQQPIDAEKWGAFSYLDLLIEMAKVKAASNLDFGATEIHDRIVAYMIAGRSVVLTDTRMPCEAQLLKKLPTVMILVTGRGEARSSDCYLDSNLKALWPLCCTFEIVNDGSYENLEAQVKTVLESIDELY